MAIFMATRSVKKKHKAGGEGGRRLVRFVTRSTVKRNGEKKEDEAIDGARHL